MPVTIDEIDAEIEPAPTQGATPAPNEKSAPQPEAEVRRECDLLARIAARAARLRAD
jgi:hypothetical protein